MKKPLVIHPLLFGIFPILFLFTYNLGQVSFSETLMPLAIVSGFTLLLLLLLSFIIKDARKAGIILSIFLVIFFSYGHIFNLLCPWNRIDHFIIHLFLIFTWGVLFIWATYCTVRAKRDLYNCTNILNIMTLSLVFISLINISIYKFKTRLSSKDIISTEEIRTNTIVEKEKTGTNIDIYYIILDRYGSMSTLKEFYDFDNSEFINYLTNKGFYIAFESRSNYLQTSQSLASSLNMKFINYLSEKVGKESKNCMPLFEMMQDYTIWRFLKKKGYTFIHFGSWFHPTSKNKYADMNFNKYFLSEFFMVLYKTTILYPIGATFNLDNRKQQWKRVLYKFDKLAEIPNIKGPKFIFVHMLTPHDPYVFDRNGNFLTRWEESKRSIKVNYIDQLIFINKKMRILIDKIFERSDTPPIIIVQADEGPYPQKFRLKGKNFNWKRASKDELGIKMRIMNAYFLPNVDINVLYPSITPVNSFRLIFNLYFNTHFELLPDESYAHVDDTHIYDFFNVSDKVKYDWKEKEKLDLPGFSK